MPNLTLIVLAHYQISKGKLYNCGTMIVQTPEANQKTIPWLEVAFNNLANTMHQVASLLTSQFKSHNSSWFFHRVHEKHMALHNNYCKSKYNHLLANHSFCLLQVTRFLSQSLH